MIGRHRQTSSRRKNNTSVGCPRRRTLVISIVVVVVISLVVKWFRWSLMTVREVMMPQQVANEGPKTEYQNSFVGASESYSAQPVFGTRVAWGDNDEIEAVYSLPPNNSKSNSVKGIVLLLHACTHNALKFFSPSDTCTSCVGLSEELRIARLALSRGYAALAITSRSKNGCWSDPDINRIDIALSKFKNDVVLPMRNSYKNSNQHNNVVTTIAIGASSGGIMAAKLLVEQKVQASLVMIMGLRPALVNRLQQQNSIDIYFAPMPRDQRSTKLVEQNYQILQKQKQHGDGKVHAVVDKTSCVPLPVTVGYLTNRVVGMTDDDAQHVVQGLLDAQILWKDKHMLLKDPTSKKTNWREVLLMRKRDDASAEHPPSTTLLWGKYDLTPGNSPLAKALHRAWAFHEYCSEAVEPALDFFERTFDST